MRRKSLRNTLMRNTLVVLSVWGIANVNAQTFEEQKFVQVSAHYIGKHSMALDANGQAWTWGANNDGQIGDNSTQFPTEPFKVLTDKKVTYISASASNSYAIDEDQNLWGWGSNYYGQMADGNEKGADVLEPMQILAGTKISILYTGKDHMYAKDVDGNTWAWGRNNAGQLGDGTKVNILTPVKFEPMDGGNALELDTLALAEAHTLALDKEGNIWVWGNATFYRLGLETTLGQLAPVKLELGDVKFTQIAAGRYHNLALDTEGNIWSWGKNLFGELGNDTVSTGTQGTLPAQVTTGTVFTTISAGTDCSLAYDANGTAYTWGKNNFNVLGLDLLSVFVPTPITYGNYENIQLGFSHALAMDKDGKIYVWGSNDSNQLTGTENKGETKFEFLPVSDELKFSNLIAGFEHTLAITKDGEVFGWGSNTSGAYGNGTTASMQLPGKTAMDKSFTSFSASKHVLAIEENTNYLWGWGFSYTGELGQGMPPALNTPSPVQIIANDTVDQFKMAFAGGTKSIMIDEYDHAWVCGDIYGGQIGTTVAPGPPAFSPVQVSITDGETTIETFATGAAGDANNSALIDMDGNLWVTGINSKGLMGDGTVGASSLWKKVNIMDGETAVKFSTVAIGLNHILALDTEGNIWAWGDDSKGQVGDNDGSYYTNSTPEKILDNSNGAWKYIAAYANVSLAIDANDKLFGWGDAKNGMLGAITGDENGIVGAPTAILSGKSFVSTSTASGAFTALLDTDGVIYTSGRNSSSQLGNGENWLTEPKLLNSSYSTSVNSVSTLADVMVYGVRGSIIVKNNELAMTPFTVYNLQGKAVNSGVLSGNNDVINMPAGLYIFTYGNNSTKVLVK